MRKTSTSNEFKVLAIAGTYVVTLGFHLPEAKCDGLLGFSIHRTDHTENEAYYLEGMKAFEATDPGFPAGSLYSTKDHPVQSFQWADYSAKPGHDYTYVVTALKGSPQLLTSFASVSIKIKTESPESGDHDVYFNRGAAASQEYVRRFGDKKPKQNDPEDKPIFDWLSRGLYEAMVQFVQSCVPGQHKLRIAAYEFHYEPFLLVLADAMNNGLDIKIIYDYRKKNPGEANEKAVIKCGLETICTKRTKGKSYISHNKFMVKLEGDDAVSVWTGGTNFSSGGIFGHSNVAHVVEEPAVANKYFNYWTELQKDPKQATIKQATEALSKVPSIPIADGTTTIFSPRTTLEALEFYGQLAKTAKQGLFMTFAFGLNSIFKDVFKTSTAKVRFALLEKKTRPMGDDTPEEKAAKLAEERIIQNLRNLPENVFAIGDLIRTNKFDGWLKESLTDLNKNVRYVHNKFMLIDPLGEKPIVVAGSANFSNASTTDNDENMLIICGNKRVADIYIGEFMRLFSHFSFRESLAWRKHNPPKPLSTGDWWKDSFGDTPRSSRRQFFASVNN
ncbi:phospholipase D-like domain-containing protein [Mucilaginibacter gynuensis]|uniref:phospholipase D n=1 Tax=Mucilaginibacter gynuensis TaxID=1302236 RepID=A0ABP8G5U8_9SPHI